jgi:hypothetical protein
MTMDMSEKIRMAQTSEGEELWRLVREHHTDIISHVTLNRNFTEDMALFVAKKRSVSPEVLDFLAQDVRFKESYKLKLAICKNPKTPQRTVFSLLKFLRIFDIADLTRDQHLPVNVRQKIEQLLCEKLPSLPSGIRKALARRASSTIVIALMKQGEEGVISACLDSPTLTEGFLANLITMHESTPLLIQMIAGHPKWSLRYSVRFALIRNFNTPMVRVIHFIGEMKTSDLKDLHADPKVPASTKPFLFRELHMRGEARKEEKNEKEEIYTLNGEEDSQIG